MGCVQSSNSSGMEKLDKQSRLSKGSSDSSCNEVLPKTVISIAASPARTPSERKSKSSTAPPTSQSSQEVLKWMKELPQFSAVRNKHLYPLLERFKVEQLKKGTVVIEKGSDSNTVFVIGKGTLNVMSDNTKKSFRVKELKAHQVFGEFGFIHDYKRQNAVIAAEHCVLLSLTKSDYEEISSLKGMTVFQQWITEAENFVVAECLQNVHFLSNADIVSLRKIASHFTGRLLQCGDNVVMEGEKNSTFRVVVRGELVAFSKDSNDFHVELRRFKQGDSFGEGGLIASNTSSASVACLTQCIVYSLNSASFQTILSELPDVGKDITRSLKQRTRVGTAMKNIPFLKNLPTDKVERLNKACTMFRHKEGEKILKQNGIWPQKFFMITQGTVEVEVDNKVVRSLGPGDYFGEVSLVSNQAHTATVKVSSGSPDVFCLECDRITFQALFIEVPAVLAEIELKVLGAKCSLSQVLHMPAARELFEKHCEREFARESIDFWLQVENYESCSVIRMDDDVLVALNEQVSDVKQRREFVLQLTAKSICTTFVQPDSKSQINIKDKTAQEIVDRVAEGTYTSDMFSKAKQEVFDLMERDNFARFKGTKEFANLLSTIVPYAHVTLKR